MKQKSDTELKVVIMKLIKARKLNKKEIDKTELYSSM